MTDSSFFKRDRFFVLKKNNIIEEYPTLEYALSCKDKHFIILDTFYGSFTPRGTNSYTWRISRFTFISEEKLPFNLSDNSWTVYNIETTYKTSGYINFSIAIADPKGILKQINCKLNESRDYHDPNSHDLSIVKVSFAKLLEHSRFDNWKQKDLEDENIKLRETIEKLKEEINSLKAKRNK